MRFQLGGSLCRDNGFISLAAVVENLEFPLRSRRYLDGDRAFWDEPFGEFRHFDGVGKCNRCKCEKRNRHKEDHGRQYQGHNGFLYDIQFVHHFAASFALARRFPPFSWEPAPAPFDTFKYTTVAHSTIRVVKKESVNASFWLVLTPGTAST